MIWHFEKNGEYTVKLDYHIGRRFVERIEERANASHGKT